MIKHQIIPLSTAPVMMVEFTHKIDRVLFVLELRPWAMCKKDRSAKRGKCLFVKFVVKAAIERMFNGFFSSGALSSRIKFNSLLLARSLSLLYNNTTRFRWITARSWMLTDNLWCTKPVADGVSKCKGIIIECCLPVRSAWGAKRATKSASVHGRIREWPLSGNRQ